MCVNTNAQFIINKDISKQSLHQETSIINLKDKNSTINDVLKIPENKFSKLTNENTDLGFTNDNYWLHFKVKNTTDDEVNYFLESSRPIIDLAYFYQVKENGKIYIQKSGDKLKFKDRTFQNRKTIFKLFLKPNETGNYYLHLKSDGEVINAPVILKSSENFIVESNFEQIVFGFFYGILIIASILYFFFFFAMKERVFLYYSMYVLFIGLLQFSLDGYFYEFLTPNAGWLSNKSVLLFAIISGFFLGSYAQIYLNVKKISYRLNVAYNLLYICFAVLMSVIIFVPQWFKYCYPVMNGLGLCLLILITASLIETYNKTKQLYQFFTLGILSLITGFVLFILKNFSLLPYNFFTENSSKLGTGLEVIFLSLSMASLIKKLKEDGESSQVIALQRSEEMNELKSYFLSNISHELRTPLNTISNFIDAINNETDIESFKEKCSIIKGSSNSLLSSVNDILDFSKIEKEEIKLEPIEFDCHKLFEEINKNISIRAKSKGIDFQFTQSSNISKIMFGDEDRLRQVIMNILSNALKFTNDGNVKFKIESTDLKDDNVELKFTVSDTGVGISKHKMSTVFESFSQQTINNKRKFGGLGLGLYIVKSLVDLFKGNINIESVENVGTVCMVTIPLVKIKSNETQIPKDESIFDLGGKKILVVEDNAMNQMVIKMITKKWLNTSVDYAMNGQEGLDCLKSNRYDIILMDLQMPVMDGYEATIAIRNGNCGINVKSIPIIAVTADVMETTKQKVIEIGMNKYLSKPVNKESLFENIKALVNLTA